VQIINQSAHRCKPEIRRGAHEDNLLLRGPLTNSDQKERLEPEDPVMGFDGLGIQAIAQLLAHGRVIHIGQLAPVRKSIVVAADPLNRLPLQESIILPGCLFNSPQINHGFMPGLFENGNCEVSFGSEIRLMSFNFYDV